MCGIVGVASVDPLSARSWLQHSVQEMRHRGPNDSGIWWDQDLRIGLGHCRLSILELSSMGHQPMIDDKTGSVLVFNGEIYNHVALRKELEGRGETFKSRSDSEVLLTAYRVWGVECVQHLDGMFAFGIYDAPNRTLLLARDRSGEKPLFIRNTRGQIRFASELKGLLTDPALPRTVRFESLNEYLYCGFVSGSACILDGYEKLPPGHCLLFDIGNGNLTKWRYWSPPTFDGSSIQKNHPEASDYRDLLSELEELLSDAVHDQLQSDVPVGIMLSGGVDSSIIAALAARHRPGVKTFTVGFKDGGSYDERSYARLVSKHIGSEHIELVVDQLSVDLLPKLARQFDEPIADSSMVPTHIVSKEIKRHCTVALGGDGADELFGGYTNYAKLASVSRFLGVAPLAFRAATRYLVERYLPLGMKGRYAMQYFGSDYKSLIPTIPGYFDYYSRMSVIGDLVSCTSHQLSDDHLLRNQCASGGDGIDRLLRRDFTTYLPDSILVKVDRSSMLSSLEVRAPYLDRRIIEFSFSKIPISLKVGPRRTKILLKMLAKNLLPSQLNLQRKQGFSVPLHEWLKTGEYRESFRDVLFSSDCPFDRKFIEGLFAGLDVGRDNAHRLFALYFFELWRSEYRVSL